MQLIISYRELQLNDWFAIFNTNIYTSRISVIVIKSRPSVTLTFKRFSLMKFYNKASFQQRWNGRAHFKVSEDPPCKSQRISKPIPTYNNSWGLHRVDRKRHSLGLCSVSFTWTSVSNTYTVKHVCIPQSWAFYIHTTSIGIPGVISLTAAFFEAVEDKLCAIGHVN